MHMFNMLPMLNTILGLILDTPLNCVKALWWLRAVPVRLSISKQGLTVVCISWPQTSLNEELRRLANTENVLRTGNPKR